MGQILRRLAMLGGIALLALALWDQLVRDPKYRTWHGEVFGIPYDFRIPTMSRVRNALWSPNEDRILSGHLFGVGWTPNVGRIYSLFREQYEKRAP